MSKIKKIFTNTRVIILIVAILMAVAAINPNPWASGAAIRTVAKDSAAYVAGMQNPKATTPPMSREIILSINNIPTTNAKEYYDYVSTLTANRTVQIKTNRNLYRFNTEPILEIITLNETEKKTITETVFDNVTNQTRNITKTVILNKTITNIVGMKDLGVKVYDAPTNNLRKGIDLQGGTRVLLKPETKVDTPTMDTIVENMNQRLNAYGLSDVVIRPVSDLSGNQYILIEMAGANEEEIKELAKEGKFESRIGNTTVFRGGTKDISYVCRSAECSGISPNEGCGKVADGQWACTFQFSITLTPEAAERQANSTRNLDVIEKNGQRYLNETIDLYLDDKQVDSLNIAEGLKGSATTDIAISGPGYGTTEEEATTVALQNMKTLQTILITGSLATKMEIVKTDAISPALGAKFLKNTLFVAFMATLGVVLILLFSYRRIAVAVPIMFTSLLEVFLTLGIASLIGWNIDAAAIAGIIAAIGTGVNDQIVITDEALRGQERRAYTWKEKMANAFYIIMGAYLVIIFAMFPLFSAGAGMLRGFALTTILGVTVGVFITRPAYANVVEILLKE